MGKKWTKLGSKKMSTLELLNGVPGLRESIRQQARGLTTQWNKRGPHAITRALAIAALKGYLLGKRGFDMRKLSSTEMALVERLNEVLESDNPTTEELTITLEISPEDIIERFPDRVYDLREKIVDTHIIFGDPDAQDEEEASEENFLDYEEGDDWQDDAEAKEE